MRTDTSTAITKRRIRNHNIETAQKAEKLIVVHNKIRVMDFALGLMALCFI